MKGKGRVGLGAGVLVAAAALVYWRPFSSALVVPEPTAPSGPVSSPASAALNEKEYRPGITVGVVGPGRQPGKLRTIATWVNCKDGATVTVKGFKVPADRSKETTPLRGRKPHSSTDATGRWQFDWDADDGMTTGDQVYFVLELKCGKYGRVQTNSTPDSFVP